METSSIKVAVLAKHRAQCFGVLVSEMLFKKEDIRFIEDPEQLRSLDRRTKILKLEGWKTGKCGDTPLLNRFCFQKSFDPYSKDAKVRRYRIVRWITL